MLAIDTNVVVRLLTNDHPAQSEKAREVVGGNETFVATTVLLEAAWVLKSVYGLNGQQVIAALRILAGLPSVTLEDPALAAFAFACGEGGMDFADALHLGRAEACEAFLTFDNRFARAASAQGFDNVRVP